MKKRIGPIAGMAAVATLAIVGCSPEAEVITETVTETVEVEVEVETVPRACIQALDEADEIMFALAEYALWATETDGDPALSVFDGAEDLPEWIANIDDLNEWLEDVNARMDSDDYDDLRSECRLVWLNQ